MNKTKIDWATSSWNPITGCRHGCEYCYAKGIAHRFCTQSWGADGKLHVLDEPKKFDNSPGGDFDQPQLVTDPYPYEFDPTFHRYRLAEFKRKKKPQNIFVVSMGDMFGAWVPGDWICETLLACDDAPQHNYMFLTKNPKRLLELYEAGIMPTGKNFWYGTTVNTTADFVRPCRAEALQKFRYKSGLNTFLSIEPLHAELADLALSNLHHFQWVIIGGETGNRKEKITPEYGWINDIVYVCKASGIPVFMKSSLAGIWRDPLIQQYPDGLREIAAL